MRSSILGAAQFLAGPGATAVVESQLLAAPAAGLAAGARPTVAPGVVPTMPLPGGLTITAHMRSGGQPPPRASRFFTGGAGCGCVPLGCRSGRPFVVDGSVAEDHAAGVGLSR